MAASATALNQTLNGLDASGTPVNVLAYVSAHTAAPSSAGTNEYSGVTRQACTWNAASGAAKTNSSALTFTTSGASAVTDLGTWTAASAGTFGVGIHLTSGVTATTITVAAGALNIGQTAP